MLGCLTIVVAHHMYAMPLYPYLATDYGTQLSLFTHHVWIGGFLIVGAAAHATIFMVRDYDPTTRYNDLLDRVLRHRDAIISHLNWVCIFLGFHSFGLYIHNDTMSALGRPQDMFSDTAIQLQLVFAQWIQNTHALTHGATSLSATTSTSLTWGGDDLVAVGGKVALLPIPLGTAVKYRATNSYVPFITVFLNKFLDNKPKGFLIDDRDDIDDSDDIDVSDDIDRDLDTELELLTMMNVLNMDMMLEIK
ncbi:hypothetical protein NC652_014324 [Populus alba x Populus x berolinensis]|nr:hypothetical protein NC652_014324 [Populus alba x Populus x berolinensis]